MPITDNARRTWKLWHETDPGTLRLYGTTWSAYITANSRFMRQENDAALGEEDRWAYAVEFHLEVRIDRIATFTQYLGEELDAAIAKAEAILDEHSLS